MQFWSENYYWEQLYDTAYEIRRRSFKFNNVEKFIRLCIRLSMLKKLTHCKKLSKNMITSSQEWNTQLKLMKKILVYEKNLWEQEQST